MMAAAMPVLVIPRLFLCPASTGRLCCIRPVGLSAMTRADKEALVEIVQGADFRTCRTTVSLQRLLHLGLRLLLWILLVILVHFLGHFVDEPLIVFRVLQIALRQDAVPGRGRIPRQSDIFFIDLVCRAANAHIGAVAVKVLNTRIDAPAALLCGIVAVISAAAIVTSPSATTATALRTSGVLIMSHVVLFFSSIRLNNTA